MYCLFNGRYAAGRYESVVGIRDEFSFAHILEIDCAAGKMQPVEEDWLTTHLGLPKSLKVQISAAY